MWYAIDLDDQIRDPPFCSYTAWVESDCWGYTKSDRLLPVAFWRMLDVSKIFPFANNLRSQVYL